MNYKTNRQKILSRVAKYGATVGGIRVDPEWFASLWPDDIELSRLDKRIKGEVLLGRKWSAKSQTGNCPVGIRFQTLLMLVALRDGLPEVAIQLMDARRRPGGDDTKIGFEIAYKDGLATFQLLEIVA